MGKKPKVLFLCIHNSCRSQMAEGLMRWLRGDEFETYSAGSQPTHVHPLAANVMAEEGIDISLQESKSVTEPGEWEFDYIVTLCGELEGACPFVPGTGRRMHVPFANPAKAVGSPQEVLDEFRRVRDMIKDFIVSFPEMPGS